MISPEAGRTRRRTAWDQLQDFASIFGCNHDMGWCEFRRRLMNRAMRVIGLNIRKNFISNESKTIRGYSLHGLLHCLLGKSGISFLKRLWSFYIFAWVAVGPVTSSLYIGPKALEVTCYSPANPRLDCLLRITLIASSPSRVLGCTLES